MYMILEQKGIINLSCYPRITVVQYKDAFRICAFLELIPIETLADSNFHWKTITLATFDNELDAHYCLWHLCHSLQAGVKSWATADVKRPTDVWQNAKKEIGTQLHIGRVIKTAVLRLSGFYEWTIEYDPRIKARYKDLFDDDYAIVKNKLHAELDSEFATQIHIKWAPGEVFGLIAVLENKADSSLSNILTRVDPDDKIYGHDPQHLTAEQIYEIANQLGIGLQGIPDSWGMDE